MQPNPWDDGEYSSEQVSTQDSAVAGDLHAGDTVHNHYQQTQPNPSQLAQPSPILVGFPQQGNVPMGQQIVYLQPQSSSPKVLGIFVIIWGAISLLGAFAFFLPAEDPLTGEQIVVPFEAVAVNLINAVFVGLTCIVSGYWMTQYKKKGIHLAFLSIFISYFLSLAAVYLGADGGLGSILGNDSAAFTLVAVTQGICTVICGLLVAIPLMSSGQGMDDSSLFRTLK